MKPLFIRSISRWLETPARPDAYMHALLPARNVILISPRIALTQLVTPRKVHYAQIRIYPRNTRLLDRARQRRQPPLRFPLLRVLAPYSLRRVACAQVDDDRRALRDWDLGDCAPDEPADGGGEGEASVRESSRRM